MGEKKSEELFTAICGESDHISRARGVRKQTGTYGVCLYVGTETRCAHIDIKTRECYRADADIVSESLTVTTLATPRHCPASRGDLSTMVRVPKGRIKSINSLGSG